jgi:hypothetical protein
MVFVIERWYRTDATTDALMMQAKTIAIAAVFMDTFFFIFVCSLSFAPSVKLTMHVSMCFSHHLTIAVQNRRLSLNGR